MSKKRVFSDDWSNLTDAQVAENIIYLTENRKKYKKHISADGVLYIENVKIVIDRKKGIAKIANKKYRNRMDVADADLFLVVYDLYKYCQLDLRPAKQKIKEWCHIYKDQMFAGAGVMVCTGLLALLVSYVYKKSEQEKQEYKQEIIREALDAFKQEQAKTINFKDSVNTKQR